MRRKNGKKSDDRMWYLVKIKFLSIVANTIDILHLFLRLLAERPYPVKRGKESGREKELRKSGFR